MNLQFQLYFALLVSPFIYAEVTFEHAPRRLAYTNAVNYCKGRYMNLVKIENPIKNDIVFKYAKKHKLGKFWINGNDIYSETRWVNTEDNILYYRNWHRKEPSGGRSENCLVGNKRGKGQWADLSCNDQLSIICETSTKVQENTGTFESSPKKLNYKNAVAFCLSKGKSLVKIPDAPTNLAVFNFAKSKDIRTYWIDGNDVTQESKWVNSDQKKLSFRNWYPDEPDGGHDENCLIGGYKKTEVWADVACKKKHYAIC